MTLRLAAAVAVLVTAAPLGAQENGLQVVVRAGDTGAPLPGAALEVGGVEGAADSFGQAELLGVPVGPLDVAASFPGYVRLDTTVLVEPGLANLAVLTLRSEARDLGDVLVEAESVNDALLRRRGFFERRASLTGSFITRAELDARGAHLFSDAFRSVPGVQVAHGAGGSTLTSTRRRGCYMTVYLDGTEMAFISRNIDALPFDDIAAIEVYRGPAQIPAEYAYMKTNDTCGAVLVWTRIVAGSD